jgi:hypothetical protein
VQTTAVPDIRTIDAPEREPVERPGEVIRLRHRQQTHAPRLTAAGFEGRNASLGVGSALIHRYCGVHAGPQSTWPWNQVGTDPSAFAGDPLTTGGA